MALLEDFEVSPRGTGEAVLSVSCSFLGFPAERLFLSVLLFALEAAFGSWPPRLGSGKVCWNKILLGESTGPVAVATVIIAMQMDYPRVCVVNVLCGFAQ